MQATPNTTVDDLYEIIFKVNPGKTTLTALSVNFFMYPVQSVFYIVTLSEDCHHLYK